MLTPEEQDVDISKATFPDLVKTSLSPFRQCVEAAITLGSSDMLQQCIEEVGKFCAQALLKFCTVYPSTRARTLQ
jgi:hypothetical protein